MPHDSPTPRRSRRALASLARAGAAGALLAAVAPAAAAQLPGVPLLQSPFIAPQRAVAVNGGSADGVRTGGLAVGWVPASGRFQVSGGAAWVKRTDVDGGVGAAGRAFLPLRSFREQSVTVGVLAGVGGDRTDGLTSLSVPIGASIGYRRGLGATRAVAVYAVPFYSYNRVSGSGSNSSSLARVALGADVAVTPRIGVTGGYEFGATPDPGNPGAPGGIFGFGASLAF